MAEKKNKPEYFNKHIPEEARQHARNARTELHKSFETLLPPGFIEHRRNARKEMLMAAREMISYAIERLETRES